MEDIQPTASQPVAVFFFFGLSFFWGFFFLSSFSFVLQ